MNPSTERAIVAAVEQARCLGVAVSPVPVNERGTDRQRARRSEEEQDAAPDAPAGERVDAPEDAAPDHGRRVDDEREQRRRGGRREYCVPAGAPVLDERMQHGGQSEPGRH